MRASGKELSAMDDDDPAIFQLGEVCIEAGPKKLRKIAKFLIECAETLEKGTEQDHFHFNGNVHTRPQ